MENLFEKIDRLGLGKTSIADVISEIDQLRARNAELEAEVARYKDGVRWTRYRYTADCIAKNKEFMSYLKELAAKEE